MLLLAFDVSSLVSFSKLGIEGTTSCPRLTPTPETFGKFGFLDLIRRSLFELERFGIYSSLLLLKQCQPQTWPNLFRPSRPLDWIFVGRLFTHL